MIQNIDYILCTADAYDSVRLGKLLGSPDYRLTGGIFNAYILWIENGLRETPEELSLKLSAILEK